jgi:hypothetical protein
MDLANSEQLHPGWRVDIEFDDPATDRAITEGNPHHGPHGYRSLE